ncbi:MAG TPA: hypothetical protein VMJ10_29995 [Kofleriaceae bacterium]|nr:hypothetical protein [Kofleriaceae bacterium]
MNDWAGFLALARSLAEAPPAEEAKHRSAISRAYYSAYNDARRYVRERDLAFNLSRYDSQHDKVWAWFASTSGALTQVATLGQGLRRKRNQADYDVYAPMPNVKYESGDAVQKANRILTILDGSRGPTRPPRP